MVDGNESRLMGFLQFKKHNVLVGKLLAMQKTLPADFEAAAKKMAPTLQSTAAEAQKLLVGDIGCPKELSDLILLEQTS